LSDGRKKKLYIEMFGSFTEPFSCHWATPAWYSGPRTKSVLYGRTCDSYSAAPLTFSTTDQHRFTWKMAVKTMHMCNSTKNHQPEVLPYSIIELLLTNFTHQSINQSNNEKCSLCISMAGKYFW